MFEKQAFVGCACGDEAEEWDNVGEVRRDEGGDDGQGLTIDDDFLLVDDEDEDDDGEPFAVVVVDTIELENIAAAIADDDDDDDFDVADVGGLVDIVSVDWMVGLNVFVVRPPKCCRSYWALL